MKIAFYNGVSGMMSYQEAMNRISHNVANSGTIGFKPDQSVFFRPPLHPDGGKHRKRTPHRPRGQN